MNPSSVGNVDFAALSRCLLLIVQVAYEEELVASVVGSQVVELSCCRRYGREQQQEASHPLRVAATL